MPSTVDGRRARGDLRRGKLLDAGLRVVERDGVAALTHRSVAKEANLAATAGTYYFPTVDDLLVAVIDAGIRRFAAEIAAALAPEPSVRAYAEFAARYARDHPGRLIAEYELYTLAARRPELRSAALSFNAMLHDIVANWSSDEAARGAALTAVDGLFIQTLLGRPPSADMIEQMLERALGRH
ncbi:TetR family transcriptional regulator [Nocardia sp. NPDC052001]|uniref:TetR/AcrR family transcriptional regulator n=1 Tax=Nocardia sp. NPDC052001 TaxID=3154853 RepID=UPI00342482B9